MSTAGQAMIKSVRANLSQKSSKKRYFDRKINSNQEFTAIKNAPKLSPEELEAFSNAFKKDLRKWKIKVWCITLIACCLFFVTLYFIIS